MELQVSRCPKMHEQELGLKLELFTTGIAVNFTRQGHFAPALFSSTKKTSPWDAYLVLNYQLREPLHLEQVPYTTTSQLEA